MLDRGGERANIARMLRIPLYDRRVALPVRTAHRASHSVFHGERRAVRGLRIERQNDDAVAFELAKITESLLDGRLTVAHRDADGGIKALAFKARFKRRGERLVRHEQGRPLGRPNLSVLLRRCDASLRQDGKMEDEPPDETVHGRNMLVHKELCQVALDGLRLRRRRRPGVHEKHAHSLSAMQRHNASLLFG